MIKTLILTTLILLVGMSGVKGQEPSKQSVIIFNKLKGEWIDNSWYEEFNRSRSPNKAANTKGNFTRVISFGRRKDSFQIEYSGFHEGTGHLFKNIKEYNSKTYQLIKGRLPSMDNTAITNLDVLAEVQFLDSNKIKCSVHEYGETNDLKIKTGIFVRIKPNFRLFVNKTIIGTYKDSSGNKYTFDIDGKVSWKGELSKYEILVDYAMLGRQDYDDCIDIIINTKRFFYAYEINQNKLKFYEKNDLGDINAKTNKSPILVLYKN